jgi:hypothetical protein
VNVPGRLEPDPKREGNREQGTENREQGTENREQRTENRRKAIEGKRNGTWFADHAL